MQIHGRNIIGGRLSGAGDKTFEAYDPRQGQAMGPSFQEATAEEIDGALQLAEAAAVHMRGMEAERIAGFLLSIRDEIAGTAWYSAM